MVWINDFDWLLGWHAYDDLPSLSLSSYSSLSMARKKGKVQI